MSLEGGSEHYNAAHAIGGPCPDCETPIRSTEHDGRCDRCAGLPPLIQTRYAFLRNQVDTFALALERVKRNPRRQVEAECYARRLREANEALERLDDEAGQRPA